MTFFLSVMLRSMEAHTIPSRLVFIIVVYALIYFFLNIDTYSIFGAAPLHGIIYVLNVIVFSLFFIITTLFWALTKLSFNCKKTYHLLKPITTFLFLTLSGYLLYFHVFHPLIQEARCALGLKYMSQLSSSLYEHKRVNGRYPSDQNKTNFFSKSDLFLMWLQNIRYTVDPDLQSGYLFLYVHGSGYLCELPDRIDVEKNASNKEHIFCGRAPMGY